LLNVVVHRASVQDRDGIRRLLRDAARRFPSIEKIFADAGKMGTGAIVIVGVSAENPAKMRLAQDHDVIQAFSADRADEAFDVSVPPG
jgi:hypothetical protein